MDAIRVKMKEAADRLAEDVSEQIRREMTFSVSDFTKEIWDEVHGSLNIHAYIDMRDGGANFEITLSDAPGDSRFFPIMELIEFIDDDSGILASQLEEAARRLRAKRKKPAHPEG